MGGNPCLNATIVTNKINRFTEQIYNRAMLLLYDKQENITSQISVDITDEERVAFCYYMLTTPKDPDIPIWDKVQEFVNNLRNLFPYDNSRITDILDGALRAYAKLLNKEHVDEELFDRFVNYFYKYIVATLAQIDAEDLELLSNPKKEPTELRDQTLERFRNLINNELLDQVSASP